MKSRSRRIVLIRAAPQRAHARAVVYAACLGFAAALLALVGLPVLADSWLEGRSPAIALLSEQCAAVVAGGWIAALVAFVSVAAASYRTGVRWSHRLWGPVHRLADVMEARIRGHRTPAVRLRRRDELHELANRLNELFDLENDLHQACRRVLQAQEQGDALGLREAVVALGTRLGARGQPPE